MIQGKPMFSKGLTLALCCLVLLLVSIVFFKRTTDSDKSSDSARMEETLAMLEQELADIKSELKIVKRANSQPRYKVNLTVPEEKADEVFDETEDDNLPEEEAPVPRADFVETAFDEQRVDSSWAFDKERQIEEFISNLASEETEDDNTPQTRALLSKITLTDSECRDTMCRIEVSFENDPQARDQFLLMLGRPPFDGPSFSTQSENGQTTLAYIARENFSLP